MLLSFVVRLTSGALAAEAFAGEVEHVETGERGDFRDAAELQAWCARLVPTAVPEPRSTSAELRVLPAPSGSGGDLP